MKKTKSKKQLKGGSPKKLNGSFSSSESQESSEDSSIDKEEAKVDPVKDMVDEY